MKLSFAKEVIQDQFLTPGFSLCPTNDGRVEVKQNILKRIPEWNGKNYINAFSVPSGLCLTDEDSEDNPNTFLGKVKISGRRIRIPLKILKATNLADKYLTASITEPSSLILKPNLWAHQNIFSHINLIPEEIAIYIAKFLVGERINKKIEKSTVNRNIINSLGLAELQTVIKSNNKTTLNFQANDPVLILPSMKETLTFRPVALPYKFAAYWLKTGELVLYNPDLNINKNPNIYYLVPGIKKTKEELIYGFLLVSDIVFGGIQYAIWRAKDINRDLILSFDPSIREEFRIFKDPPSNLSEQEIKKTESFADKGVEFLERCFRPLEKKDIENIIYSPVTIKANQIEVKRETKG